MILITHDVDCLLLKVNPQTTREEELTNYLKYYFGFFTTTGKLVLQHIVVVVFVDPDDSVATC